VLSEYDVIIVGAGPAGLAAAEELSRSGRSVLVLEKNAVIGPKVCAGGIPAKSWGLDLPEEIVDNEISSLTLISDGRTRELSFAKPFLVTVDRKRLGQYFVRLASDQGAEILCEARVTDIASTFVALGGAQVRYRHLIGADGCHSIVRKYVGLPTQKIGTTIQYIVEREVTRMELHFSSSDFGSGFAWVVPHRGYTIVGTGLDLREARGRSLREICRRWCSQVGIDIDNAREESWPINCDYRGWKFGNIFLIGDAAGLASGLTGEGIPAAVLSGRITARRIIDPSYTSPLMNQLLRKLRRHAAIHELMCFRPRTTRLAYGTLTALARVPGLKQKIVDFLF
jgi:geranylgeranyl reductase family protein